MMRFAHTILALFLVACPAMAGTLHVAGASNFQVPLKELARTFEAETGHEVIVSSGATGLLFSQIANGAPYDVFLAADQQRPLRAIAEGLAVPGSDFTYAIGRLFLLMPDQDRLVEEDVPDLAGLSRVSVANPRTAPYGVAAIQVLDSLDIGGIEIAYAQNVAGVAAAVQSGAVPAGLTALSLAGDRGGWVVPADLYDPIRQDAVLLVRAEQNAAARAFLEWLQTEPARAVIRKHGYDVD